MLPDRLSAIASAALNRGATSATHNLGGLHADVHHATMCGQWVTAEQLDTRTWEMPTRQAPHRRSYRTSQALGRTAPPTPGGAQPVPSGRGSGPSSSHSHE